MAQFFNISGELTQELLAAGSSVRVNKISFTNIEGTNKCTVDLYIEKKLTGKFYLLKDVELPIGATLIYDNMKFNNETGQFSLYIKLTKSASETPTVDVIIN
tara:strand:- start:830 stop:1135 length:306 start_codon:yes stop_codon:yes gene_type:complete